jgi:hypothetical protein
MSELSRTPAALIENLPPALPFGANPPWQQDTILETRVFIGFPLHLRLIKYRNFIFASLCKSPAQLSSPMN